MTEKFYSFTKAIVLRVALVLAFVSLAAGESMAQNRTITGTVKDSMGPVMAASVVVEGTTVGVSTATDGTFRLDVPAKAKQIKVSYVGYDDTYVVLVPSKTDYEIFLKENSTQMDEVVVVGYGTVNRRDVVGSVSSVSSEDLVQMPVASVTEAMSGRMAGVQVTTTEGDPDAEIKIRVRGSGSITQDSSPLYIVDGFPVESISDIPASDIQSIDVLKDAFSTAIYGSRGANGVIIVTTKSGQKGRVTVNYNLYYGFKKMANKEALTPQNTYDFVRTQYEYAAIRNDVENWYEPNYGPFADIDLYDGMVGNDWIDQVFGRTGNVFNHNISVSGGGDKFQWTAGYTHHDEKAIMIGSTYKRNNLNFKAKYDINKRVSMDFNIRYSDVDVRGAGANALNDRGSAGATSRLKNAIVYSPIPNEGITSDMDDFEDFKTSAIPPVQAVRDNDSKRARTNWNANAAFQWEIIDNLKLRVEAGLDDFRQVDNKFYGVSSYYAQQNTDIEYREMPAALYSAQTRNKIRNTNTLSYDFDKVLPEDHNLVILAGQEYIKTNSNTFTALTEGFPETFTADMAWNFLGTGANPREINNKYAMEDRIFSFFGRVNYDYKGKYIIAATMRADGSSKFTRGNRWGYFPSAAASWRISGEEWMKGAEDWLDNLKIRYSFGTAGNNNIPSGQTTLQYQNSTSGWINMGSVIYIAGSDMPNPDLKWETTYSHNVGVDFSFWQSRLSGSVELYKSNTKDLLIQFPVKGSGYDNQYRNLGEVENRGIEATINASLVRKQKWGIDFSANISFNENEVVDLGGLDQIQMYTDMFSSEVAYDYVVTEGRPLGDIYGYTNQGMYAIEDFDFVDGQWKLKDGVPDSSTITGAELRPGSPRLADYNGDGEITNDDIHRIGNVQPLFNGGFSLSAYAYGFDFSANFTYSYGNKVYNGNKIDFSTIRTIARQNVLDTMSPDNRWTNIDWATGEVVNDPAKLAAMNEGKTMWTPYSSRRLAQSWAIEDASFLRLASLTIGYTVPQHLTRKIRLDRVRVYATGTNLFCWTPYSGYDPEVDTRRKTPLTPSVDHSAYPKSTGWVFGINLSF